MGELTKDQLIAKTCYMNVFGLMLHERVPEEIMDNYILSFDSDDEKLEGAFTHLQAFVLNHMRGEIYEWSTALGIIEAADRMYSCAKENDNLKHVKPYKNPFA